MADKDEFRKGLRDLRVGGSNAFLEQVAEQQAKADSSPILGAYDTDSGMPSTFGRGANMAIEEIPAIYDTLKGNVQSLMGNKEAGAESLRRAADQFHFAQQEGPQTKPLSEMRSISDWADAAEGTFGYLSPYVTDGYGYGYGYG